MQFLPLWVVLLVFVSECQRLVSKKASRFCACDGMAKKTQLHGLYSFVSVEALVSDV